MPPLLRKWLIAIGFELDELGDAILTANKNETLSLRFARWRTEGNVVQRWVSKGLCMFLSFFQRGHCDKVLADWKKRQAARSANGKPHGSEPDNAGSTPA